MQYNMLSEYGKNLQQKLHLGFEEISIVVL